MFRIKILYILFIVLTFFSCSENKDSNDKPVAKVGDKILYISEIHNLIPKGLGVSDSALMAEDYIKKWIQKELLISKAEENLSAEQKDVSKELEEYRSSLIIYKYKKEMVGQKMDSVVSESAVKDYYEAHIETFRLNRNIVKAVFLKIPKDVASPDQLKLYCQDGSDENFRELKEYCLQYAKSFDTFNNSWVEFDLVLNNLPNPFENQERMLERNNLIEMKDSEYYYLVCIHDHILAGQPAPVDYVSGEIKNLILNKRKLEFLKKIEVDIYNDGVRNNKFNIYDVDK